MNLGLLLGWKPSRELEMSINRVEGQDGETLAVRTFARIYTVITDINFNPGWIRDW